MILISVDGLNAGMLTNLLTNDLVGDYANFQRFVDEGATTFDAHNDYDHTTTLPNHTSMLTGRPVLQPAGQANTAHHGYTDNGEPDPSWTLHNQGNPNLSYVASLFDVAHDNGLTTGLYASKTKFIVYEQSYDVLNGAPDVTGPDDGTEKIDNYVNKVTGTPGSAADMQADFIADLLTSPPDLSFVHYADPDPVGHASGWGSAAWDAAVHDVDVYLGEIFSVVESDPGLNGTTVIILTSDHGGSGTGHLDPNDPEHYRVPFFVWGPGVDAGADLYALNPTSRTDPGATRPDYDASAQPIRNGDGANLALDLLGLAPVVGSTINASQDLMVDPLAAVVLLFSDFESGLGDWSNAAGDDFDWTLDSGGTPSSGTGPTVDRTLGTTAGTYLYTEASDPNYPSKTVLLDGPCLDLTGMGGATLTFWYHMVGSAIGTLYVEAAPGCSGEYTTLHTIAGQQQSAQGDPYLQATVDLSGSAGSSVGIRFRGVTGSSWAGDITIDDVQVEATPAQTCSSDLACDDGIACTIDSCVASFCQNVDGCSGSDTCNLVSGVCEGLPGQALVDALDLNRFKSNIRKLSSQDPNPPPGDPVINGSRHWTQLGNMEAVNWIASELASYGYTNVVLDNYTYKSTTQYNVYATKIGTLHPEEMYIISAHLDSKTTDNSGNAAAAGADDDASGTSAVLEAARVFGSSDVETEYSIRFAFWNNEETGLNGSSAYVNERLSQRGVESPPGSGEYPEPAWRGMIQHDLILWDHGYPYVPGAPQSPTADVDIEYDRDATFGGAAITQLRDGLSGRSHRRHEQHRLGALPGLHGGRQHAREPASARARKRLESAISHRHGRLRELFGPRLPLRLQRRADDRGRGGRHGRCNRHGAGLRRQHPRRRGGLRRRQYRRRRLLLVQLPVRDLRKRLRRQRKLHGLRLLRRERHLPDRDPKRRQLWQWSLLRWLGDLRSAARLPSRNAASGGRRHFVHRRLL
ncbi:MAG: M20/M25/M40 family metallo-hydrolase [Deltaproteobacteria bacterium]|nr:M20/M25/M40 family metallo-hydrolase [Deltaproteobacteria bacterium]